MPKFDPPMSVPVNFKIDEKELTERQWKIVRSECQRHGCNFDIREICVPDWPVDCSMQCRNYVLKWAKDNLKK